MEVSSLAHIKNPPENPIELFTKWHDDVIKYSDPNLFLDVMTIANRDENDDILNRNVILRASDSNGFIFVTERNTKKYKDFVKIPNVAATFLWIYTLNATVVYQQVRVTGKVCELNADEIAEFYKDEPVFAKIRSKISRCGEKIDWDAMKLKHDKVLTEYNEGKELLPQQDTYTAMRIVPSKFDFYFARKPNEIADRVEYSVKDGKWIHYHIAP